MKKYHFKLTLDIFMVIALPCLMAYSLIGECFHEILGTAMGCVFIAHNILNSWWHKNIFRGRYNAQRILTAVTDTTITIDVLALLFSGIVLSTFVFVFVNFDPAYMTARLLHLCASYWGFLLMSFHAGLHIPVARFLDILTLRRCSGQTSLKEAPTRNDSGNKKRTGIMKIILTVIVIFVSAFGVYCFIKTIFSVTCFCGRILCFWILNAPEFCFFWNISA